MRCIPYGCFPYPLRCPYPTLPDLNTTQMMDLEEMIRDAIEQKSTTNFIVTNTSSEIAHFLLTLLFQNEKFKETLFEYKDLDWTPTTTVETRILLIIKIVNQLERLYTIKTRKISIVSVGSGKLLQEYLLLRALLFRGFKAIELNTVDPAANHLSEVSLLLAEDNLKEGISLSHFNSSFHFITEKQRDPHYKTDVCFMVSYQTGSWVTIKEDVAQMVARRGYNFVKFELGSRFSPAIELLIPYDVNQSFLRANTTVDSEQTASFVAVLNKEIRTTGGDTLKGIVNTILTNTLSPSNIGTNMIWISFFDIIKTTGQTNTLSYAAISDFIDEFVLVDQFPYWDLIPQDSPKVIWPYHPETQEFY